IDGEVVRCPDDERRPPARAGRLTDPYPSRRLRAAIVTERRDRRLARSKIVLVDRREPRVVIEARHVTRVLYAGRLEMPAEERNRLSEYSLELSPEPRFLERAEAVARERLYLRIVKRLRSPSLDGDRPRKLRGAHRRSPGQIRAPWRYRECLARHRAPR